MEATLLYSSQCYLGEGPLWHEERRSCFWVDIERGVLYEYKLIDKSITRWEFNYKVTMVIAGRNNEVVLALNASIATFDLESEQLTWLLDVENGNENRCNDGNCDSLGRLWVGTMHKTHLPGEGALYCIADNKQVNKIVGHTTISNGLAWSLDNTRLYFIDSPTQVVQSFIYNEQTAEIFFEKNCIQIPAAMGTPDGMAIDEEGMLWIAHWGGFGVYRWNPFTGEHLATIEVPVPNVTSCAFAGENLDQLIIITARENLTEEQLKKYPQSGDVFLAKPGVKGVKGFKCNL
jgi:sugar lactone lactonase YvrE